MFFLRKHRDEAEWRELYKEYKASGLNLTAWCRKNNVGKTTMYKNVTIFEREEKSDPDWIPVRIENKVAVETLSLNINEVTINIKDGFNKKTLEDILDVIRKVC